MNKQVIYKFIVPILIALPLTISAQKANNDVQSMTFDGKTLTIPLPGAKIKEALSTSCPPAARPRGTCRCRWPQS